MEEAAGKSYDGDPGAGSAKRSPRLRHPTKLTAPIKRGCAPVPRIRRGDVGSKRDVAIRILEGFVRRTTFRSDPKPIEKTHHRPQKRLGTNVLRFLPPA